MIRIFDTRTAQKIGELRRGTTATTITDIAFDLEMRYLTCTSDRATIHIFKVAYLHKRGNGTTAAASTAASENTRSYFSALSSVVTYAGSEWSFAQFRLQPSQVSENDLQAVVHQDQLHVVSKKGWYFRVAITAEGGNLTEYSQTPLLSE